MKMFGLVIVLIYFIVVLVLVLVFVPLWYSMSRVAGMWDQMQLFTNTKEYSITLFSPLVWWVFHIIV